jgi:hypothetical protein
VIRYQVQDRYVKAGFIADAEDKIEESGQPVLDAGTGSGWTLHSIQATAAAKWHEPRVHLAAAGLKTSSCARWVMP